MIKFFLSILMLLSVSSISSAETRIYGDMHIALTKQNDVNSKLRIVDRSSYIGINGIKPLDAGLFATFKFEIGVDTTNHFDKNSSYVHYSFAGVKGDFGEFRIGRQDSAYDIVDNSMDDFLTEQGNGLITKDDTVNLVAFIRKIGKVGFYSTHVPGSGDNVASSSLMINYALGPIYTGLGFIKENKGEKKLGTKLVVTYKKDNLGIGFIHEKCPSRYSRMTNDKVKRGCSTKGNDHINNISVVYRFGKPYLAAQYAKNSKRDLAESTLELGLTLGKGTKAYLEFDKVGSNKATTIGLRHRF